MANHPGPLVAERDGLRVLDCRECGYAHLADLPADQTEFYRSKFWQTEKAGWREIYEQQADWDAARFGDWLSRAESATLGRTLLDVGCGYGFFMRAARERGWQCEGVETNTEAADYCVAADFPIVQQAWHPEVWIKTGFEKYDCLAALWLIEHLPDPLAFLRWARQHIYGGGCLLVAAPNEMGAAQYEAERYSARGAWWVHPTHLNYFTPATLGNLLGRTGFVVRERLATYPMESFLIQGLDYTASHALGQSLHETVRIFDLSLARDARIEFYCRLARAGMGRDLVWLCIPDE